jgi:hypothetical protein
MNLKKKIFSVLLFPNSLFPKLMLVLSDGRAVNNGQCYRELLQRDSDIQAVVLGTR